MVDRKGGNRRKKEKGWEIERRGMKVRKRIDDRKEEMVLQLHYIIK